MPCTITIRDESASGDKLSSFSLECLTEEMTIREIIRSRVYQEVMDYNQRQPKTFRGLVQPGDAERTLNGFKLKIPRQIDWEKQFEKAIDGFMANVFFVLVDEKQAEELDERFKVTVDTEVSFVKLVPLVGG